LLQVFDFEVASLCLAASLGVVVVGSFAPFNEEPTGELPSRVIASAARRTPLQKRAAEVKPRTLG
jgi:hypothetical protein